MASPDVCGTSLGVKHRRQGRKRRFRNTRPLQRFRSVGRTLSSSCVCVCVYSTKTNKSRPSRYADRGDTLLGPTSASTTLVNVKRTRACTDRWIMDAMGRRGELSLRSQRRIERLIDYKREKLDKPLGLFGIIGKIFVSPYTAASALLFRSRVLCVAGERSNSSTRRL